MPLALLLILPFAGSLVAALLPSNARNAASTWAGLVALGCLVQVALLYPEVSAGTVLVERIAWIPSLEFDIVIRVDGFAWMFAMLVTGVGLLVLLYARYYMSSADPVPRFYAFFLAFMGAMLGVVLSGHLIQLVLFWELTSLVSFLLVGYWHHRRDARRGARMALIVTGFGGLCLLVGVLLLGSIAGTLELDGVLNSGSRIREHSLYPVVLTLVLLGVFTKSAQFPFQFWLPQAMAAPTPVSAYLHSATMVKAGVFLLARLWPVLAGTEVWFWTVTGVGTCTLLLGAYAAMFQHDLKGLLAYSTISHLGLITLLLGLNSPTAAIAAVFHMMNHATFKASLFMAAGIVDHETGTRDIRRLSGLGRLMPITATLAMVASAAMAGVPLLNGFLSKEMFFAETVFISTLHWVNFGLPLIATLAGIFAVIYSLRFSYDIFFGPPSTSLPRQPHEPPRWMRVPIELLVLACLVVGIFPSWSIGPALAVAAAPVVGGTLPEYNLAVWHGFNAPMIMSLIAMAGGVAGYLLLRPQFAKGRLQRPPVIHHFDGKAAFESVLLGTALLARRVNGWFNSNRLQTQLFWVVVIGFAAAAAALWGEGLAWGDRTTLPVTPVFVLLWGIGMACAVGCAYQAKYHRLAALMLMAAAGLVVCITFMWFSAPDLALTQLSVEVVTTVLFLLGLRWLPSRIPMRGLQITAADWGRRGRDLAVSILGGAGLAALAYAMMTRPFPQSISPYFLERALTEGGGANVVNVILVDFRGFDTFGEITVLGIVAITVYALLRRFRPPRETLQQPRQQRVLPPDMATDLVNPRTATDTALGYMMVPAMLARLLLPLTIVVALYLFLRGHNAPGGGFVAGLVIAIALITQYMVAGTTWVEAHLPLNPPRWIAIGLLFALGTGAAAMGLGYPFLTTHTAHLDLPVLGEVHIASAMFFDVGVFAVVVGSTLLVLTVIAHQSVRGHRRSVVPDPDGGAG
jgi:multicomponent K+:H+ antiporter subunit A